MVSAQLHDVGQHTGKFVSHPAVHLTPAGVFRLIDRTQLAAMRHMDIYVAVEPISLPETFIAANQSGFIKWGTRLVRKIHCSVW
jgi:hypothetical protein